MSDQGQGPTPEPIPVSSVVAVMIEQLASLAWQRMGLHRDSMTGKIEKDIGQARLAIDVVADLCKRIEPDLDADDVRSLQNLVRDLRMNYVEQSKELN